MGEMCPTHDFSLPHMIFPGLEKTGMRYQGSVTCYHLCHVVENTQGLSAARGLGFDDETLTHIYSDVRGLNRHPLHWLLA